MTARFITFEGGEGVGKSTQIKRLISNLTRAGVHSVRTREPGGTPRAEAIRSFLLQGQCEAWGPSAEAVLFAAARLDHVRSLIAPNLESGKWVLSDRFSDSTRAYQGLTGGVPVKLINALETLALDGHAPDLTIILDLDPRVAFERLAARAEDEGGPTPDRFEREAADWHGRLRESFLEIADNNRERCVVISADADSDMVEAEIWQVMLRRFPEIRRAG